MAGIQGQTATNYVSQPQYKPASVGKGDAIAVDAMGRPTLTDMRTPIVYGKTYLDNYTSKYVAPLAKDTVTDGGGNGGDGGGTTSGGNTVSDNNTVNSITGLAAPVNDSIPDTSMNTDNSGNTVGEGIGAPSGPSEGSADGTAYANGTTSVPGYYNGTIGVDDDPWAWTKVQPVAAPLAVEIKPSNEQALGRMPDKIEQQLGSMVMNKGVEAATKGINTAYKAYNAAPLAAAADTGTAIAATGTGSAATGAALAGGEAALAAMGPVGWTIGAGLLAKKLGIF